MRSIKHKQKTRIYSIYPQLVIFTWHLYNNNDNNNDNNNNDTTTNNNDNAANNSDNNDDGNNDTTDDNDDNNNTVVDDDDDDDDDISFEILKFDLDGRYILPSQIIVCEINSNILHIFQHNEI